jgi:hypothetical protein
MLAFTRRPPAVAGSSKGFPHRTMRPSVATVVAFVVRRLRWSALLLPIAIVPMNLILDVDDALLDPRVRS